ncbi:peptidase S8/S53 domain-containing protein [Trichoderma sp. TUCIM 5745]
MAMKDRLNKVNFGLRQSVTFSKKQESLITELSHPINFSNLCKSDLDQCNYQAERLPCAQHQVLAANGFEDTGVEQEATYDNKSQDDEIFDAPLGPTLRELTFRPGFHRNPQYSKLEPHHKTELQFLIACSLLNLDGSHWIQSGLHGNTISLCAAQRTSDFLEFWQPYTTCILSAQNTEADENLAILSFGILLVETEAGEIASQIERGGNHNHNAEALRCILERTLREGAEGVGVSYKNIAGACLHFATHFETFYDPLIDGSDRRTKRSGAIYKYIVAPLFRLCTQRFQNVDISQPRTIGFPLSAKRYSVPKNESSPRRPATNAAFFDGSGLASSTRHYIEADSFMNKLQASAAYIRKVTTEYSSSNQSYRWRSQKIRIAILDTGIDLEEDSLIKAAEDRIKERCSFMNDLNPSLNPLDCQDVHGHGTHVARLILTAAPSADIFIAKISNGATISPQHLHRVARAITWAIDKKVDIITMSCGTDAPDEAIDKAIERAVENKISIFAATSNSGGNKTRVYPSSRRDGVIGIHASDGYGNDGGISPTPLEDRDNFSTLGIDIPSRWKKESIRISGTSYATPIAAALVANMLELARCKCDLTEHQQRMLRKYNGVCRILELLVGKGKKPRGGYDYIVPEISEELEERFTKSLTKIAEEG